LRKSGIEEEKRAVLLREIEYNRRRESMTPMDLIPFALSLIVLVFWTKVTVNIGVNLIAQTPALGFVSWWGAILAGMVLAARISKLAGLTW
jgi:hypothetical protein